MAFIAVTGGGYIGGARGLQTNIIHLDVASEFNTAYQSERHELRTDVTKYPVESATTNQLIDHAIFHPHKLTLEIAISRHGAGNVAVQGSEANPSGQPITANVSGGVESNAPQNAWAQIISLMETRTLVTVVTLMGMYTNMIIVNASANVDVDTGANLLATLEFQEVVISDASKLVDALCFQAGSDQEEATEQAQKQPISTTTETQDAATDVIIVTTTSDDGFTGALTTSPGTGAVVVRRLTGETTEEGILVGTAPGGGAHVAFRSGQSTTGVGSSGLHLAGIDVDIKGDGTIGDPVAVGTATAPTAAATYDPYGGFP